MRILTLLISLVLISACNDTSSVNDTSPSLHIEATPEHTQAIRTLFEENLQLSISAIRLSPMPGLYEVSSAEGLFYVTGDAKFIVRGNLFSIEDERLINHTESAMNRMRVEGLLAFNDSMISYPAQDEKHKITIFTDITCGYCRRMHGQIEQYNALGISIDYMAFPRYGLSHPSFQDLVSIWCAADPVTAMTKAKAGKPVKPAQCDHQLEQHFAFAQKIGVNATPALVTADGALMPGYLPPKQLLKALEQQR